MTLGPIYGTTHGAGSGDVEGPASSTDNAIVRFNGGTGKLIQGSGVLVTDAGAMTIDVTTAEAFLVRKDADAGDVFAVDTENPAVSINGRILGSTDVVASANDLTLTYTGNNFLITGTTQVTAITTAGWRLGIHIMLMFTDSLVVKHNTAGGAGTGKIYLAGSQDLNTADKTILGLFCAGNEWHETFRKVA